MTRAMCWLVPCPEAHLLLLDWVWGGGRPAPVLGAMLDSLAGGKLEAVRRLAFAQMIVSAQAKGAVGGGADVPVLVSKRNDVAAECLRAAMTAPGVRKSGCSTAGCTCQAWRKKWRNWGSNRPRRDGARCGASRRRRAPRSRAGSPSRRCWRSDGTDWAATITDAAEYVDRGSVGAALAACALYVVRHGAVYYSLGKWVLEWNKQLFDDREMQVGDGSEGLRG